MPLKFPMRRKPGPKPTKPRGELTRVLLRVPSSAIDRFDALAAEFQRSRTAVMVAALLTALEHIEMEGKELAQQNAPIVERARARKLGAGRRK